MTSRDSASSEITPEVLLRAYACGIFPMAESADDPTLFWVEPEMRGVIPLDGFRISSRLARTVRCATDRTRGYLDQQAHPRSLLRIAYAWTRPQRRGLAGRRSGRRALRGKP